MLKRRTPSGTDLEKWTPEQILEMFGKGHLIESIAKSLSPHDSRRNLRQRERKATALKRKAKRQKYPKK